MELIGWIICVIIGVSGIVVLGSFMSVNAKTQDLKTLMEKEKKSNQNGTKKVGNASYQEAGDVYDLEKMIKHRRTFNEFKVDYMTAEQIIPIIPLMGLLGTVIGLIPMLSEGGEKSQSLGTAMYTTVVGLVVAIVLKFIDANKISKTINEMEMEFEQFDYTYQMVNDKEAIESVNQE